MGEDKSTRPLVMTTRKACELWNAVESLTFFCDSTGRVVAMDYSTSNPQCYVGEMDELLGSSIRGSVSFGEIGVRPTVLESELWKPDQSKTQKTRTTCWMELRGQRVPGRWRWRRQGEDILP